MTDDEKLARQRVLALTLMRLAGLALVMAGAANIAGKLAPQYAPALGAALLVMGAADFFIIPAILKKRWRTPEA